MLPHRWLEIDDLRSTRVATLGGKDISDMEAYAISGSLGRNRHLRFLDLYVCLHPGASAIVFALPVSLCIFLFSTIDPSLLPMTPSIGQIIVSEVLGQKLS